MPKFASKSTLGFYSAEIHGKNMPDDVVKITDEAHATLIEGQSHGKIIDWSGDVPVLADPAPPSGEELTTKARAKRGALLTACDWTQVADAPVDQAAWRAYRQALRDVPEQPGFPYNIDWPVAPQ